MCDDWESDGDNSKRYQTFHTRQFSNRIRYNDRQRGHDQNRRDDRGNFGQSERKSHEQNHSRRYNHQSNGDNIILQIPTRKIGKLIGRGGSTVKDLQSESECRIKIDSDRSNENVSVTLEGSSEAQSKANRLIEELMANDMGPPRGRAPRGFEQHSRRSSSRSPNFRSHSNSSQRSQSPFNTSNSFGHGSRAKQPYERDFRGQNSRGRNFNHQNSQEVRSWDQRNYGRNSEESESNRYGNSDNRDDKNLGSDFNDHNSGCQDTQNDSNPLSFKIGEIDFDTFDWTKANEHYEEAQKKRWAKLPSMKKNFYSEDSEVQNMTDEEVERVRRMNNNITVKVMFEKEGEDAQVKIPNPIQTFEQAFQKYPEILQEIYKQKFEKPSPIQCQAWPILLSGLDMIGIAQTGTGKTLAFLLPALIHIDGQDIPRSERKGPNVLILAPTRELALQIDKEVSKYTYRGIKAVCLYGGGNRKEQINVVSEGVQIVIATPGRMNDLVQAGVLNVECVTYLILDEADRMLDMGFEPQIRKTLLDVRPDRQTVMTSATWPAGVRRLAQSYMKNPVQVCIGTLDLEAVNSVTQTIIMTSEDEKHEILHRFFNDMSPEDKVIVFLGKKARVDSFSSEMALQGINCQSIHGNREQSDREQALEDLRSGDVRILLATDVASRGIDIEDVTHVFNFDFPRDIEDYVHRVGRTGRAGRTGESITLMTRSDWSHAKELIEILERSSQNVPQELYEMADRYEVFKEKRSQEKDRDRMDARGAGGRRRAGGGGGGGTRRGGGNRFWNNF